MIITAARSEHCVGRAQDEDNHAKVTARNELEQQCYSARNTMSGSEVREKVRFSHNAILCV